MKWGCQQWTWADHPWSLQGSCIPLHILLSNLHLLLIQVHLREIPYQPKFYPTLSGEGETWGLLSRRTGAGAEHSSRHNRATGSARSRSMQQRLQLHFCIPTAFLEPCNSNMDPFLQYKELLKMPPAKLPMYLTFLRKLMRLNMLETKSIVFKSADWLPETNGDRSETETCFSLFSCPSPLPPREEKTSSL